MVDSKLATSSDGSRHYLQTYKYPSSEGWMADNSHFNCISVAAGRSSRAEIKLDVTSRVATEQQKVADCAASAATLLLKHYIIPAGWGHKTSRPMQNWNVMLLILENSEEFKRDYSDGNPLQVPDTLVGSNKGERLQCIQQDGWTVRSSPGSSPSLWRSSWTIPTWTRNL